MAGKKNERAAQTVAPAKDAAVATATDGTTEPPVNAPAQESGQEATPAPEMVLHVNGKDVTADGVSEGAAPGEGQSPYDLEPICTIGPGDMGAFSVAVFEAVASLIAGAGFFVRHSGEQVSPFGRDILAANFQQEKGITAVTADGRKFILKDGEVNEAQ